MVSLKNNSHGSEVPGRSELKGNDNALSEFEDNKFNYPLKSQSPFEKQNTFSDYPSKLLQTDKSHFLTSNHQLLRKKSKLKEINNSFDYSGI